MQRDEVQARARHVFFDSRVHHTQTRSGLLIFLSLYEHQAVILADSAIAAKLQPADLETLCQQLTESLHWGKPLADALCQTIAAAGRQLAAIAPREANDVNELPDALVILDQGI
jgi:putative membrane protein